MNVIGIGSSCYVPLALWAMILVFRSINLELKSGTWDLLRMSNLSPWELSWTRVLGAASSAWYALFIVYVISASTAILSGLYPFMFVVKAIFITLNGALIGSILAATIAFQSAPTYRRDRSQVMGFTPLIIIYVFVVSTVPRLLYQHDTPTVEFAGYLYNLHDFVLMSSFIFLVWSLVALMRQIKCELQTPTSPAFLPLFLLFVSLYLACFNIQESAGYTNTQTFLLILGLLSSLFLYSSLLSEDKNGLAALHFLDRSGNFPRKLIPIPTWWSCLIIMTTTVILQFITALVFQLPTGVGFGLLSLLFFAVRDTSIFLIVNLKNPMSLRNDITAVIVIALLYTIIPAIVASIVVKFPYGVFFPSLSKSSLNALNAFYGLPGCAIALGFLWYTILQVRKKQVDSIS